jgi:hypothetical protein
MLSNLLLFRSCASSLSPLLSIDSYNLEHLFFVKLLEPCRGNDLLVILFGKKKASLLQSLAVEIVCVLEDLADGIDTDVLSKDVLALSFN